MKIFLYASIVVIIYLMATLCIFLRLFPASAYTNGLNVTFVILRLLTLATLIPILKVLMERKLHIILLSVHLALGLLSNVLQFSNDLKNVINPIFMINLSVYAAFLISLFWIKDRQMGSLLKAYAVLSITLALIYLIVTSLPDSSKFIFNKKVSFFFQYASFIPYTFILLLNIKMLQITKDKPLPEEETDGSILTSFEQ